METSDSENFESADENFDSEEECTVVGNLVKKLDVKCEPKKSNVKDVENLTSKREQSVLIEKQNLDVSKIDDNSTKDNSNIKSIDLNKNISINDSVEEIEENLWDNDDWGTIDDEFKQEIKPPVDNSKQKLVSDCYEDDDVWETEGWEPFRKIEKKDEEKSMDGAQTSWGAWGNWGVTSLLSTATQGVSSITKNVSHVLESSMGIPQPEELAKIDKHQTSETENVPRGFGLGNLATLTKIVENAGNKVITSGLDTLETIGKKTMEVLQEGDPGLRKKRAFLRIDQDKPVLSQLLREAKEKAESENKILEQKHFKKKANYEAIFDDHQGLVHLEALEMLSKQCDMKLQTLLETKFGEELKDMQETLDQVKELCEIPDEDEEENLAFEDISQKLTTAVTEINIPITYDKLMASWEETDVWLNNLNMNICSEHELHQQAIETLAQLTAMAVEQFHKTGEYLLIKEHRSTADEADSLVQLTTTLTSLIGVVAGKFSDKLNSVSVVEDKENINSLITNVFFEAANSSSYVQDAFQLLIPVLQVGAV